MTTEAADENQAAERLAQILEAEANMIEVSDAWDAIANRLVDSEWSIAPLGPISATRRRRRVLGSLAACIGVAAAIVLAVVVGWRPAALSPAAPVASAMATVPRYDASIRTLVVYRTTAGEHHLSPPDPPRAQTFTFTPERTPTASRDVGRAALEVMMDTAPVQPGNTNWLDQGRKQDIDVTAVTVASGLIRVELNGFFGATFEEQEARVMVQAWVWTLQDTLGVNDDVLIRLHGKPFYLYGTIDTTKPLTRDDSIQLVRPDGFDSPRNGDVVPSTSLLLGSTTAGRGQPGRVQIVNLETGAIAYEQEVLAPGRSTSINFAPVLTLEPGRYRATVQGHGAVGVRDITFTVVP